MSAQAIYVLQELASISIMLKHARTMEMNAQMIYVMALVLIVYIVQKQILHLVPMMEMNVLSIFVWQVCVIHGSPTLPPPAPTMA